MLKKIGGVNVLVVEDDTSITTKTARSMRKEFENRKKE